MKESDAYVHLLRTGFCSAAQILYCGEYYNTSGVLNHSLMETTKDSDSTWLAVNLLPGNVQLLICKQ